MSLEDMAEHFRFCRGDSSFAMFKCCYCGGSVTSAEILMLHIRRSHKGQKLDLKMDVGNEAILTGEDAVRENSQSEGNFISFAAPMFKYIDEQYFFPLSFRTFTYSKIWVFC